MALLSGVPKLVIPVPGDERKTVSILPACRDLEPDPDGNCAIVDFKIIAQDVAAGTGTVYVNWEDSEQGGDYDQDMKGTLSYKVDSTSITVTTDSDAKSTPFKLAFGYVISGTTQDGFHAHSGANGFSWTDDTGVPGCTNCQIADGPTWHTYTLGNSTAGLLEQPLWYASKYGSFNDTNNNKSPDLKSEWDADDDDQPDGFFLASNPAELGTSLARFLDVIATASSSSSVAANSVTLLTGTSIYQGRYNSEDWSGDLVALPIKSSDGSLEKAAWHARDTVTEQASKGDRRIVTSNEQTRNGVPFRWGSNDLDGIADVQKLLLCPACTPTDEEAGEDLVDYLRGSSAKEEAEGGTLRNREYKLGDVVNSDPVYVGLPVSHYPEELEGESYLDFVTSQADRTPMVYVGSNDGMFHSFNAKTGSTDTEKGKELFAYVPRAVYPNLSRLASPGYQDSHRYFIDGGPTAADVYLSSDNQWHTVLVAGLGAGGAGVFAMDVTDPSDFSDETTASEQVLWDITGADTGFEDLGYTFSKPTLARMPDAFHSGTWAAVFGNGYENPNGKAVLYILDAADGTQLQSVVADPGPANGLSSVATVDYDRDAKVDYLYAGDLKGNLWRLEPDDNGNWIVSFGGKPLFKGDRPITVRPEVIRHPFGGMMVLFGTGSYYRTADRLPDTTTVNSFYGVWDRLAGEGEILRDHLLAQGIVAEQSKGGYDLRVTSDYPITWHRVAGKPVDATTHLGWYLDLLQPPGGTKAGEIQVTDPKARGGRIIFTTAIPSPAVCDFGGDGWLMELNALDGRPMEEPVFDLNGDLAFSSLDQVEVLSPDDTTLYVNPTGKKSKVGIIQEPTIVSGADGTVEYKYASGATAIDIGEDEKSTIEVTTENPGELTTGRRSWLQQH